VQEQGISARRRSILLRGLNNADAEGVMPKALRRYGSPLVKNLSNKDKYQSV
jgi:hypothetical protein